MKEDINNNSKAILSFNMEDCESMMHLKRCVKSLDMALCLFDIKELLVQTDNGKISFKNIHMLTDNINQIMDNYKINIDDLVN